MAESKVTKIKKKKWIRVIAPSLFKNEQMGEVPVSETNSLIGRAITVNLMSLTRDMRKQNTSIKFIISHIKGENASTEIYGYYLNAASIKRLVRRGKEKIGLTVICKTSDNKKIRMMPLIIPHNKVKGSVSAAFKKSAREFITSYVSKITFEETIRDLITNKLQKETKTALKKIYPVRILEVAKMHLEKSKKPLDQNVNVIDLTSSKDEDEEMDEDIEEETKEDIEEKIAGIAGKDRLVLTSSRDLNEGYTIPDDKPASFGIRNLFTKASLLAPILAITKKQSLLVTPESTISLVKQDIDNFVTRHDLNPNTITILASPGIVPHSQYGTTRWDTVTQSFFQIDGAIYGSSLNDYYQDVSVGRIFGFSSSDVSSYIARVLSFVSVKQGDEAKMISCRISSPVQYSPSIVSELLGDSMNLENERFYGDFDLQNLLDKRVIVYEGHGNEVGTLCGFTTDNLRSEDIYLNQALVIHSAACLTCSYGVALSADTLDSFFCAELIRRGAIGVLGATDVSATNVAGVDILDPLLEGENLGESFRLMSIKDYSSLSYYHEPFHTLIGDPTLRIFDETYDLNEKVEVLKSEWREDDTGSVYYHMELSFSSSDINSFNLPTGELLYETDAYYGDNVKSSYIYRLERDPTDYNEEKFVKLNVDVNNPSHLNFQSISSAKVIIDGNEIDVSSGFISNPLNVINRLDTTHLEIPVVLSFVDLESSSVPSFTLIVDFEITE